MKCSVCHRDKLPHQVAHKSGTDLAVCFGGEGELCGSGGFRAPFWLETVPDERLPVYTQLAAMVAARAAGAAEGASL